MNALFDNLQVGRPEPTYVQIFNKLMGAIQSRALPPGSRLPDERELARKLSVGRGTVRRALAKLQEDGYLIRHQGRGTFVADADALPAVPIGLVFSGVSWQTNEGFASRVIQGALAAATPSGAELLLLDTSSHSTLHAAEPAAYVLYNPREQKVLDSFVPKGRPVISVDHTVRQSGVTSVVFDNVAGARKMTERLIELGHRDIAYLDGKQDLGDRLGDMPNSKERWEGCRSAMTAAGIKTAGKCHPVPMDVPEAREATEQILKQEQPPTAIFTFSEMMAAGAYQGAIEAGRRVPEDLSIVCFCDMEQPHLGGLELTGLGLDARLMGRQAVEEAVRQVSARSQASGDAPEAPQMAAVPHCFLEGATLGRGPYFGKCNP